MGVSCKWGEKNIFVGGFKNSLNIFCFSKLAIQFISSFDTLGRGGRVISREEIPLSNCLRWPIGKVRNGKHLSVVCECTEGERGGGGTPIELIG